LEILDSTGQRLKTFSLSDNDSLAYEEINDEYDPGRWPLVQKVLAGEVDALGDKYAQIVQTADGFVFYTAGPIVAGDDLAGVVLVGTMLDSFVTITQAEALADVTVYDFDGNPLATTFAQPGGASSNEASLDIAGEILDATLTADSSVREQRALWGRGYELGYGTLQIRDQAVGLYSVGLPSDFIFAAGSTTRTQIALLFGLGMVSVLGIGFFLAHRLTKPLLQLVRTARLVASGDLTARSGVTSADEIGTLASSFDEMTGKLQSQHLATIRALTGAIDARDPHTMGHSMRVGQLAIMIGRHLGLDEKTLSHVEIGGYLHDIGKIGIRDAVLLKPDRLTPEERLIIEEHPRIGLAILAPVDLAKEVLEFVESHHERLNGSGYPHGLRDDLVSIVARVAAVSDVYDAVTSERPYRDPMAPEEGLALLRADAGSLFDPRVVEAFAIVQPEWERRRASEPELQGFKLPDLDKTKVTV
jgi:putative nucleotidyltransferase with HDIG domain